MESKMVFSLYVSEDDFHLGLKTRSVADGDSPFCELGLLQVESDSSS